MCKNLFFFKLIYEHLVVPSRIAKQVWERRPLFFPSQILFSLVFHEKNLGFFIVLYSDVFIEFYLQLGFSIFVFYILISEVDNVLLTLVLRLFYNSKGEQQRVRFIGILFLFTAGILFFICFNAFNVFISIAICITVANAHTFLSKIKILDSHK